MRDTVSRAVSRRSFLRGSILAGAAMAIVPSLGFAAQDPSQGSTTQGQPAEPPEKPAGPPADRSPEPDAAKPDPETPSRVTLKDDNGQEYRECPQCGFNMYRQDRTWTCENCGYSYTE